MIVTRRGFLKGMAGILAAAAAPAIITTPGLLMPVRKIIVPGDAEYSLAAEVQKFNNDNADNAANYFASMALFGWAVTNEKGEVLAPKDAGKLILPSGALSLAAMHQLDVSPEQYKASPIYHNARIRFTKEDYEA